MLLSRAGTAMIALVGHSQNVPIIACCETHKFSDRVQIELDIKNYKNKKQALGILDDLQQIKGFTYMKNALRYMTLFKVYKIASGCSRCIALTFLLARPNANYIVIEKVQCFCCKIIYIKISIRLSPVFSECICLIRDRK